MIFVDRVEAGRRLAVRLEHLRSEPVVVLGLPRGGVPVAFQVAQALGAPLDVIVVRKLGLPFQPELGMGAIGEGDVRIINRELVERTGVTEREIAAVEARERTELDRRVKRFRGARAGIPLHGRTALIVDDGIATGSTARAACQVARARGAARIVLAVPVAPPDWKARFAHDADELIALQTPRSFSAIGQFYLNFNQTSDDEVVAWLDRGAHMTPPRAPEGTPDGNAKGGNAKGRNAKGGVTETGGTGGGGSARIDTDIELQAGAVRLTGRLTVPEGAIGVVVFAHGSGSTSHSPRNRYVAGILDKAEIGTLLFDLLTLDEEHDRAKVFDIELLAGRLVAATEWLRSQPRVAGLPVGYFGASTGAAAALWAAAEPGADIAAVVSRGGRPDLAADRLEVVPTPTLLIVGGHDEMVLGLNRQAKARLRCENRLVVIPGATHLFEEPGTLHAAAEAARNWFTIHLAARVTPAPIDLTRRSPQGAVSSHRPPWGLSSREAL
ncbi:MAG: dienelactone hydrolase family protein [Actinobacteria bacterium]|nr:dienelactone hydrolase family protein [Actinomycetota bacterium]